VRVVDRLQAHASRYAHATPTRVGRVLLVVLLGAALQIVTQTLLARTLPKTQVGLVSLLLGALPLLSSLSMVGQDASTVRFLTRGGVERYDFPAHVSRTLAIVLPLGAAVSIVGAYFYDLAWWLAAALLILVVSQNAVTAVTSVQRAAHRYERAMTGIRLPGILSAAVLVGLRIAGDLTFRSAVIGLSAAFASAAAVVYLRRLRGEPGTEPVPRSVVYEGLFFLGLGISFSVMVAMDKVVIGKMMSYADLAVFASVFAIMRGFDFVFYSISFVLMPRVNVVRRLDLRLFNLPIAGLAAVVVTLYLVLGSDVVSYLYNGQYDEGARLIVPFALSGVLKLFYSVPSSVIGGRLPRRALRQFMLLNLGGMVVNIALVVVMIRAAGLSGAAYATLIAWAIRLAGGYVIVGLNREHLADRPVEALPSGSGRLTDAAGPRGGRR
jgi:O-antigen/teichoic acid export membrane protein